MGLGFIFRAILFVASVVYQQVQHKKLKAQQDARADAAKGQKITVSGTVAPLPVVYGKQAIGGIHVDYKVLSSATGPSTPNASLVIQNNLGYTVPAGSPSWAKRVGSAISATFSNSGQKNEFLFIQSALCHGGIQGVEHLLVNGIDYRGYTEEQRTNNAKFSHMFFNHNSGGTACSFASANGFLSTNRFTGAAFCSSVFKLNRDEPQYSGIPTLQWLVKGMKVRTVIKSGSTYTLNTTYSYTNNSAYCLLDYLLNEEYGRGLTVDEVDLKSFYDAAQVCDLEVMSNALTAGDVNEAKPVYSYSAQAAFPSFGVQPYQEDFLYLALDTGLLYEITSVSSGTPTYAETTAPGRRDVSLYECNLTLDTGDSIRNNIERIMGTMNLAELVWTGTGKYKLILNYPENAAQLAALVSTSFTEDNIIRESITVNFPPASDRFNQVTVNYSNEHENFKEDSLSWPSKTSSVYSVYLEEDNNQPLNTSLTGDGITNPYHAQAFAEHMVRRSRGIYTITFVSSKAGLVVEPGDVISVDLPTMSINEEVFKVESVEINEDFSTKISAYYYSDTMLAWNVDDDVPYPVRPTLDFSIEAPSNFVFTSTGEVLGTASGKLTWDAVNNASVTNYLVEISSDDGASWQTLGLSFGTSFDVVGLQTGVYDFAVRAVTITGFLSARALVENETIQLTTVGQVAVIYADTANAATNTQSYTVGANTFVAYFPYTGELPTLPVTTGITFSLFVGADGATGQDGTVGVDGVAGPRGAGWWRYTDVTNAAVYYDTSTQSRVNAAFASGVGLTAIEGDRFIIACTDSAIAFIYNSSNTWVTQAAFIDGNLLVDGTVTADKISVTNLQAVSANIGLFKSAATGERVEIADDFIRIYDSNNTLRVAIGDLTGV